MNWNRWNAGNRFLRALPLRSQLLFYAGTFFVFLPTGLLTDVTALGATPPIRLAVSSAIAGATAALYVLVARFGAHWMAVLAPFHIATVTILDRWFGPLGPELVGAPLHARLGLDVGFTVLSMVVGFTLLSTFVRIEGARFGTLRAEVELARQIHRVLVPPLATRLPRVEFRGLSLPSGDVGGDLVDVVEREGRWTAYVVDVSGHGVASGLLMGMVKSAARVALDGGAALGPLLTLLNRVIFDLKSPTMFATFAGLQSTGPGEIAFSVAGHLPILRRRPGTTAVEELTMAQLPIAMFETTAYEAASLKIASGDLFVILTDGLTEVVDGKDQELGLEQLKALVAAHGDEPLETIERLLLETARAHGTQIDDQSLLLVRIA